MRSLFHPVPTQRKWHGCRARAWPALLLLAAMIGAGCGPTPVAVRTSEVATESLVWPQPPAEARIRYMRNVATPADWGVNRGAFERFVDALTGKQPLHFVRPTGVAARDGVLFVADPGAQCLFILDVGRAQALQVRRVDGEDLVSPVAVALGPADTVFLVDSGLKKVFALDREGRLLRLVAREGLVRPAAAAYDANADRLYVADSSAHLIAVYTAAGRPLQTIGSNGRADGEFNFPTHLALTRERHLLVTDALNYRVQAFDETGRFLWKLGHVGDGSGDFAAPKGVAADNTGQVYVVDALFDAVQIFGRDGTLLLGFGRRGKAMGQFWLPGGIFIDAQDTIYVADAYNQRIQVFRRLTTADGGAK